jgi:preprotein translocase subunit SecF
MLKAILNKKYKLPFLKYSKRLSYTSAALCLISIALLFTNGLNKGIDFSGGILIEARFEQEVPLKTLRKSLINLELGDVSLQDLGNPLDIMIRIGLEKTSEKAQLQKISTLKDYLNQEYGESISYRRVDFVGPTVGRELVRSGILALIFSFLAILIYIWIRFSYYFGMGAILALLHDVTLMFGFFSLTGLEFNLTSIAAILTIIGYSINDSVVIYDRIRENTRKYRSQKIADIINRSINETLNRTILTAITTIAALLSLAILGGPILKSFSFAVLFGVIIGTYSSIYIAASVVNNKKIKKLKC